MTESGQLSLLDYIDPVPSEERTRRSKKRIKQADTSAKVYADIKAEGKWNRDMQAVLLALSKYQGASPTALELAREVTHITAQEVRSRLCELKEIGLIARGAEKRFCTVNPKRKAYCWVVTKEGQKKVKELNTNTLKGANV